MNCTEPLPSDSAVPIESWWVSPFYGAGGDLHLCVAMCPEAKPRPYEVVIHHAEAPNCWFLGLLYSAKAKWKRDFSQLLDSLLHSSLLGTRARVGGVAEPAGVGFGDVQYLRCHLAQMCLSLSAA